ncbi:hypothetical protein ABQE48_22935 [Mycolicibacterium thermoresistibile]
MTNAPGLTTTVPWNVVGTAAVVDLEAACELYGRSVLPYPLGRSRPVGSVWLATRDVGLIDDRLHDGDLRSVRAWVEALVRADVCVECRVTYSDAEIPDLRLHGLRADESGFLAVQRSDRAVVDAVDIYAVPPGELGAAIADAVGLVGAGTHAHLAVAGFGEQLPAPPTAAAEYDDFGFPIPQPDHGGPAVVTVDAHDVVASGTVQTRSEPAAEWGVTPGQPVLQWVQVRDDGDYLYAPGDAGYAEPLHAATLRGCVDDFIAHDLAVSREHRDLCRLPG